MVKVKTPVHGRYSTYTNWGCRCEKCRAANASYQRNSQERKRTALRRLGFNVTPHRRKEHPAYSISDRSRAIVVRKLLPKQAGVRSTQ